MKKILFIHQWHSVGGAGISLYHTWKSLQQKYNIVTYIPGDPPDLLEFLQSKGLKPKTYPFTCGQIPYYSGGSNINKLGFWYLLKNALIQIPYWKKVILDEKPDLIMVNSKVLCWMSNIFKGTKSLCFVRETVKGNPTSFINKLMNSLLDKFTLVSFLSEYDLVQTNLDRANTVVSPDFLYLEDYEDKIGREKACKQLNLNYNSFNVAFAGGMDKLKGIDIALEAMKILKDDNVNLVIAGNSIDDINDKKTNKFFTKLKKRKTIKFSKGIKSFISDNKLENCISFIGVQNNISTLYSASDVLIFPMREPHQARPAFEIGSQKKPVIISDFPNIREYIKEGVNGLTFEPNNPNSLATAILRLKNDENLKIKLGCCNYKYTMQYHTEKYAIGLLIDKIDEILQ